MRRRERKPKRRERKGAVCRSLVGGLLFSSLKGTSTPSTSTLYEHLSAFTLSINSLRTGIGIGSLVIVIIIGRGDCGARESGERGAKQQFPLLKGKAPKVKHLTRCCTSLVLSMKVQHVSST